MVSTVPSTSIITATPSAPQAPDQTAQITATPSVSSADNAHTVAVTPQPSSASPDKPKLSVLSHDHESSIELGDKDIVITEKLEDVWKQLQTLTASLGGKDPYIRAFAGKDKGEIAIAVYYTDANGDKKLLEIDPQGPKHAEYTTLKEAMRGLHRELVGTPSQTLPFEDIRIPKFKNDLLYFFENGYFDKMNQFIEENKLEQELPPREVFARIVAVEAWINSALTKIGNLIEREEEEIDKLAKSLTASDRKALAAEKAKLQELQNVRYDLTEIRQNTGSERPQRLMINWVVGMNQTLNNPTRAEQVQNGLLQTLEQEDEKIAKESSFSLRQKNLNPFKKKGPNSLPEEARRQYSHSAAALTLYHNETSYINWCDRFGRQMKSDSTARLVIASVLSQLSPQPEPATSPIFSGAHLTCNEALAPIFEEAAKKAKEAYDKASFKAATPKTNWRHWVDSLKESRTI